MGDFNKTQPTPQPNTSTEFNERESGVPVTGFTQAPDSGNAADNFEKGTGVGNSRRGIH